MGDSRGKGAGVVSGRRKFSLAGLAWATAAIVWATAAIPPYFQELWKTSTPFIAPNDPVAIDINGDGANEIVVSDSQGRVTVFSGSKGKQLWSVMFKGTGLTAPVVGHFWGDSTLDVAVGDSQGYVHVLNGGDGRHLQTLRVGSPVTLDPTLLPPDPSQGAGGAVDFHPGTRDRLLLITQANTLYCLVFDPITSQAGISWEKPLNGIALAPASLGDVDGDGRFEVLVGVATSSQGLLHVLRNGDGAPVGSSPETYNSNIITIPSSADVNGDGRDEIFFGTKSSHLHVVYYDPNRRAFGPLWEKTSTVGEPSGDPMIVFAQSAPTSIVIPTRRLIVVRRASDGMGFHQPTQASLTAGVGLASGSPGARPRVVFGDELGDVCDWWVDGLTERGNIQAREEKIGLTPILADFDGQAGAECLLSFPELRRMRLVAFPDFPTAAGAIVWQTRGGTLWRTGWRDIRYYEALRQRYAAVDKTIADDLAIAREALAKRAWVAALTAAGKVLAVNSQHPEAKKLHRRAWVGRNKISLAVGGSAALAVLAALLYGSFLLAVRNVGLKQAGELVKSGKVDEAVALYFRLHRRFPHHGRTNATLADLLIAENRLEMDFASVFEHAHAAHPGDVRLLGALSECYARSECLSPKARDTYLKAIDVSPRPSELKFLIGRSFMAEREYQEGARFLNDALAEGFQNERVYQALADAYLELGYTQPEILPVLETVYPQRTGDARFLVHLCEAYLANERTDNTALRCAQQVLALDPACPAGQILYARILLEHGQAEGAWRRAETLLREMPEEAEVLRLASRCLIASDRADDRSVEILEKALGHFPDDPHILPRLSHIYFARGWFDPHAAAIHRHAAEVCPNDAKIVEALVALAEKEGDKTSQAKYLERLIALGRTGREMMLRLARVYLGLGVEDLRARQAYEAAVQENPDDRAFLQALGKVYIGLKETSPAAVAVLRRLYSQGAGIPGLDRQLIAGLDRNAEHGPLIEVCDKYLAAHRDDREVRRIRAHALLAAGQTDRAVAEFEQLLAGAAREPSDATNQMIGDLALAYATASRTDDRAVSLYTRALRLAPSADSLYRALAVALAKRGDLDSAIAQFRSALRARKECAAVLVEQCEALIEEDPARTALRWFLSEVLINCGRFQEAAKHLSALDERLPGEYERVLEALGHILQVNPENAYARSVRGRLQMRLGRLADARTDLEEANRLQPNNEQTTADLRTVYEALLRENEDPEIRLRLGRIYHESGDSDTALRYFQKSVRDYRFEAESTRQMGKIFMEKNLLDLALEEFQKTPLDEEMKDRVYQLAQLAEQRGDKRVARSAYRLIFAADAGFRDVQQRFEALAGESAIEQAMSMERTTIIAQLSEKAKQRYRLLEEIGRGAMGIVYRCMDSELDEVVALKILPDNLSKNDEALTRFRREARSARRLSHRNIVRIHDIGEELGRKYISMEFVEGKTLKAILRETGSLELPRVLKYGCQMLDALSYAHSIGIVHRDIKPANIIISLADEVKITDFGIAKILESTDATAEGAVVGTPLYMSPEQVRGEPVDHRADLYSVGILLYELIEGKPPFVKGDLAYSHLHLAPEPMSHGIADLERAIMRALEKRREDRWPNAQSLLDALKAVKLPE